MVSGGRTIKIVRVENHPSGGRPSTLDRTLNEAAKIDFAEATIRRPSNVLQAAPLFPIFNLKRMPAREIVAISGGRQTYERSD